MRFLKWIFVLFFLSTGCASSSSSTGSSGVSLPGSSGPSVLQFHLHPNHDGAYIFPGLTQSAAAQLKTDPNFHAAFSGPVYAQPLYLQDGVHGGPTVYVVTEQDMVIALDANTGQTLFSTNVGAPVPLSKLPCGNIDPLGITGTPVIDPGTRNIYFDAMTTTDGGTTMRHKIFAVSVDDGSIRSGWPVDVETALSKLAMTFDSRFQNQRPALNILNSVVYIGYGGHDGDCGTYHGWLIGVSTGDPTQVHAWKTRANQGAIWAPGGIVTDGSSLFASTGNTGGTDTWADGEAVIRFSPGPVFSENPTDYFTPADWKTLDDQDLDIGGSNPVLLNSSAGATADRIFAIGKSGVAYLLNLGNLGGIGNPLLSAQVATPAVIAAPAWIQVSGASLLALKGRATNCPLGSAANADLFTLKVDFSSTAPMTMGWCAVQNGAGNPIITTTDGSSDPIVWSLGSEGDNRLHGFSLNSGNPIVVVPEAAGSLPTIRRFQTPMAGNGRIYVATDSGLYAFRP